MRPTNAKVVRVLLASALVVAAPSLAPAQRASPTERVAAQLQQTGYELGIHLLIGDARIANQRLLEAQRLASKLRNVACPRKLRTAIRDATEGAGIVADAEKHLDEIAHELDLLAEKRDMKKAREYLAEARAAHADKDPKRYKDACVAVMDEVVGQIAGLEFGDWTRGLRELRSTLGSNPTPQRMREAAEMIKRFKGAERFRQRAYEEALQTADDLIAAAADDYLEYHSRSARELLSRAQTPLLVAGRASGGETTARRLSQLYDSLVQADRILTREADQFNNARFEGFRILREARSQIAGLLDQSVNPAPAASEGADKSD